jgi:hypothetical protein
VSYLTRLEQLDTRQTRTDRTDKTNLVSFVSSPTEPEHKTPNDAVIGEPQHVVLNYKLLDGGAGALIDPFGAESAVRELAGRYGTRLDVPALLAEIKRRDLLAADRARQLIARASALPHGCLPSKLRSTNRSKPNDQ